MSHAVAMDGSDEVTLSDGVITLRRWRLDDAPSVFAACQDRLIARFVPIPQPYTHADAQWFVTHRRADWDTADERSFAIVDARSGELHGSIARHGPDDHRVGFGYWLAPAARGRGIATRALTLIVDWTARTTEAVRYELYTDLGNDASGRVALRAGFELEGVRRAWDLDRDGRPQDAVFYVLVRGPRTGRSPDHHDPSVP